MTLPFATWILITLAGVGVAAQLIELYGLWRVRHRRWPEPPGYPGFSVVVPLAGVDEELRENLESHLAADYPGDWELVLGVRSEEDPAYPIARAFAAQHPERVRLAVQQGEPGHNPKVNQLITLTQRARYDFIAVTDSNVRVGPGHLREHAAVLAAPRIGLSTHGLGGIGERSLGAILDNMTLASFCAPNLAAGDAVLRIDQVVGKSIALRRSVLDEIGGWHAFKDVLAEDQVMGTALKRLGLRSAMCPSPVLNVQRDKGLNHFWERNSRWAMIRFRVLVPGVFAEPLLNTTALTFAAAAVAGDSVTAWTVAAGGALFSAFQTQTAAHLARGYGFKSWQLLLVPLRDLLFLLTWLHGATMREVTWRGNRFRVLAKTRLAPLDARGQPRPAMSAPGPMMSAPEGADCRRGEGGDGEREAEPGQAAAADHGIHAAQRAGVAAGLGGARGGIG